MPRSAVTEPKRVTGAMTALFVAAGLLVLLAGVQLFVFTTRTDRYFAWTINPPLTAAFLGGAYWSTVALQFGAARQRVWAYARISVPTTFVFTTITLVVTIVHRDKFHFGPAFEFVTRAVTWTWLAIYVVVPILMVILAVIQLRRPGGDPPRQRRLPVWLKGIVAVQAVALLVIGSALLIAPVHTGTHWPWMLTPLTARAIGAWLVGLGVAAAHALFEDDPRRLRPAAYAYVLFGALQAVALLRFPDDFSFDTAAGIAYLVFLASTVVVGVAALLVARATESPATVIDLRESRRSDTRVSH